ncbi:MAG: DNA polymerase/3'-5' exonuclease PolX [Desulfomonilia bacterium]|nr:DNA polymerase/3'-5' exonuclease PolX [Desulfomonilia bacterium]
MPIHNKEIADIFEKTADLLEIEGANQFRVRAYRNAARIIGSQSRSVAEMVKNEEDLTTFSGIGKDLAGKIREIVETGSLPQLEKIQKQLPEGLSDLMKIPGLGPKRIGQIHKELGVSTRDEMLHAARDGKIRSLEGFGEKTEQKILEELQDSESEEHRTKYSTAREIVESIMAYLDEMKAIKTAVVAGSFRRRKESVGDIDILVTCSKSKQVMDHFTEYEDVVDVISKGSTRSSVLLRSGLQIDLRAVPKMSLGAALHYFTGSKAHNIAIRKIGRKKHLKINEYGVFRGDERIAGKTEEEVFQQIDLPFIEPELREDRGEIDAARTGSLPTLVREDDIRGDLHMHTRATDGKNTLEDMVKAARERGYQYVAITEHSPRVTMAKGLSGKNLLKRGEEMERLNERYTDITILKSAEVDILEDGSLDYSDDILKELDLVVCSVHYNQGLSRKKQTERILRAMENPHLTILGHPTGRLINERKPYEVDLDRIMHAAVENGCFLELNAHPDRLDLTDVQCKRAQEMGLKVAISTDAHSITDLDFMQFGVNQARRGWLEKKDVINTRTLKQLRKMLKRS